MIMEIISAAMIVLGLVVLFGAVVGLVRFPDFYTRIHAAGIGDTLATVLLLGGFALYNAQVFSAEVLLVSVKILFILIFIFLTSPTSTHALLRAGYEGEGGKLPWKRPAKQQSEIGERAP